MMTTDDGKPYPVSKRTHSMRKSSALLSHEEAELALKAVQKHGGTSEQLCRVEDKLDRILNILNNR